MRKLFLFAALAVMVSASAQSINTSKPTSQPENNLLSEIILSYKIEEVALTIENGAYGMAGEATWCFEAEKIISEKGEYQMFLVVNVEKGEKRMGFRLSESELKTLISEMKRINSSPYPANNPEYINGKFVPTRKVEFSFHLKAGEKPKWNLYTSGRERYMKLDNFDIFFEHLTKAAAKLDSYK